MPIYCYQCEACDGRVFEPREIAERNVTPTCACGSSTVLNPSVHSKTHSPNFNKPIELYSMAPETPEQRADLVAVGATFTPDGVPIAHNRTEKKRLMEAAGVVEMN